MRDLSWPGQQNKNRSPEPRRLLPPGIPGLHGHHANQNHRGHEAAPLRRGGLSLLYTAATVSRDAGERNPLRAGLEGADRTAAPAVQRCASSCCLALGRYNGAVEGGCGKGVSPPTPSRLLTFPVPAAAGGEGGALSLHRFCQHREQTDMPAAQSNQTHVTFPVFESGANERSRRGGGKRPQDLGSRSRRPRTACVTHRAPPLRR